MRATGIYSTSSQIPQATIWRVHRHTTTLALVFSPFLHHSPFHFLFIYIFFNVMAPEAKTASATFSNYSPDCGFLFLSQTLRANGI